MNRYKFTFLLSFVLLCAGLNAQDVLSFGQWRDHLPYNSCKAMTMDGDMIYVATDYDIFTYNLADFELRRINKLTGLSDVVISDIKFSKEDNTLVIAYKNCNVDLYKDGEVINIPDIKRKQIIGDKTIYSVYVKDGLAYLSCGFGVVVLDIDREEIKSTWFIGENGGQLRINDLVFHEEDNHFYAATANGIMKTDATSNPAYFGNWTMCTPPTALNDNFSHVESYKGNIYAVYSFPTYQYATDTMYLLQNEVWHYFLPSFHSKVFGLNVSNDALIVASNFSFRGYSETGTELFWYNSYNPGLTRPQIAMFDKNDQIWVADRQNGLYSMDADKVGTQYLINGPAGAEVSDISLSGKTIWAVPGGRTSIFGNIYKQPKIYCYNDKKWQSYEMTNHPVMQNKYDFLCVAADPADPAHAFIGTWGFGVLECKLNDTLNLYDVTNSSLQASILDDVSVQIGGLAFDNENNLWVTNSSANDILSVRKTNGEWKSFNFGSSGTGYYAGNLLIDKAGQKWIMTRDLSLLVYNDNNTIDNTADDQAKKLTAASGNGALDGGSITAMAVDNNGLLWLGTGEGVMVIYSPESVFTGGNYDAQKVKVEEDGYLYDLLWNEVITAIAVNGNNEKWFGTENAGVFLMSPDGTEQIYHFTEENSPLLSNSISSIDVNTDGEVIFGTANGIVVFRDYAMDPKQSLDSVYVYPSPVTPDYTGPIAITNLIADADVKITDISGNLIWEERSYGGRLMWNGKSLEGRRVDSGVYLVFIANSDGSMTKVAKVMVIR